jgi:F0F1-type ATP synthase delta subunit
MKYLPSHYAKALYEALEGQDKEGSGGIAGKGGRADGAMLKRFAGIVRKNGDGKSLNTILARYEKIYLEKKGLKKIEIESASPISAAIKAEIEKAGGGTAHGAIAGGASSDKVLLSEKVNPDLLAGIKLLVNDTLLIDASGRTRINKLFA